VSDDLGRTVGGATDSTTIPDSYYDAARASQSFLLSDPGSYRASFSASTEGIVRVRVRELDANGGVTTQALFLIPSLPEGAMLTLDADAQDVGATSIGVDLNGDGVIDETLSPDSVASAAAVADTTPPTAYGGATLAADGSSQVTLEAEDAGSGVAHIYYSVGGSGEQTYTGPFEVPMLSTVSFRAMDEAGNVSSESSFVADDAPNTRRFADPIAAHNVVQRLIDPPGDVDWFTFLADGASRYKVQLDRLPGDYDVQLFDGNGNLVDASHAHGTSPETLTESLPAGTYYIEIAAATGTHASDHAHPYRLQLLVDRGK
jgi:hypothetical protein